MQQHPLSDFKFCPHCGNADFHSHDAFSKVCGACGFVFYPNAAAATVAVIVNERNELLCVRRSREPAQGTLDLPGGFVDPGESVTEGLCREVREEVGLTVTNYSFLCSFPNQYPYAGHTVHTADMFFRCEVDTAQQPWAHDDAEAVCWIPWRELCPCDFGLNSIRQGLEYLQHNPSLILAKVE